MTHTYTHIFHPTPNIDFRVSPLATKEQVTTTHDPNYVTRYLSGDMTESENRNIGFPWRYGLYDMRFLVSVV